MNSLMSNNPTNILSQFNQFRSQLGNRDPKEIVNELMSTGKMSPEQFKQLQQQAKQLEPLLKGFMK